MSIADVTSRISEIQARFGVQSPVGVFKGPSAADFAGIADLEDVARAIEPDHVDPPGTPAHVHPASDGPLTATVAAALQVQRDGVDLNSSNSVYFGMPLPDEVLTSDFGLRSDPFTGESRMHRGLDLSAPTGTPIRATAGGTVTWAGAQGSYGELVIIDHGGGIESRYAHQSRVGVQVGEAVEAGQVIGEVGSTGRSTGPHLHFELRINGEAIDPTPWLNDEKREAIAP
ncbi:MAG: M23 family metallopeptidase [Actinobacteria bacterium]|nr:M23 family metallopeptidase [Actinomycetota bacterium]